MPAATADGAAAGTAGGSGGAAPGSGPEACFAARVAAALAGDGSGQGSSDGASVVSVAGDLPDAVRAALPASTVLVDAGTSHAAAPDAVVPHVAAPQADARDPATHGAPDTALLVLDNATDDARLQRRLGAACRRFPGRLLVWQRDADPERDPDPDPDRDRGRDPASAPATPPAAGPVPVERFFAFGFRRVFAAREDGVRHVLHEYRLADYKQPPDWLNARYWANPERFHADPDEVRDLDAG